MGPQTVQLDQLAALPLPELDCGIGRPRDKEWWVIETGGLADVGEVGADPLVLLEAQNAVLPGETVHCLLVPLHPAHALQVLVQDEYAPVGQPHCQQGLALDGAEGQSQRDIVHPAAYDLSNG